ncbi:hypothetical protein KA344_05545 [bacterium]|jgi:lipopolysaccharide export system protein LptA|nr:hypothetical protein [bacterium]
MNGLSIKRSLLPFLSSLLAMQVPLAAMAQAPDMGGGGPIDIKAEEQEFAGDHIIARGHVRVVYKDSVIVAPVATLYRDVNTGQPQKAIFTGHPHLVQGNNKIDADTLVFEMVSSKIMAEGHAHSEVVNEAPPPAADQVAGKGDTKKPNKKVTPASSAEAALAQAAATKGSLNSDASTEPESKASAGANGAGGTTTSALGGSSEGPTTIITDSDRQVYDRGTGQFEAFGHVKVKAGDIDVLSDHLRMAYGADQKPEAAVFTGKVSATQGQNNTQSDTMTYFLNTKRLQATGHVRSKVIQSNNSNSTASKSNTVTAPANEGKVEPIVNGGIAANTTNSTSAVAPAITNTGAPVIIVSDTQDYNKETGRLDAVGNCKIFYEDTVGIGPKIVMVRNAYGQAEKVVFIGRSQITQPGKRWIGDRITMIINDRRVLAEGNTRAFILQKKMEAPVAPPQAVPFESAPDFKLADKSRPTTSDPDSSNSDSSGKLSTTKVDRPE